MSYARTDPAAHLAGMARELGLPGSGTGLLTGVDVTRRVGAHEHGVRVTATVGLGDPIWAAAPPSGADSPPGADGPSGPDHPPGADRPAPGTINVVAWVPARLGEAALVNAVATVVEAKTQALAELRVAGTGTCTDAVVVGCPTEGPVQEYAGPRSTWGARLARAVHRAVVQGGRDWLADPRSWSTDSDRVGSQASRCPRTNLT
jgi:adenosylcobinamide amidohydrolase